ncbi:MAG TPA: endoribonuclease MazF [Longimicrobiales bacterium]
MPARPYVPDRGDAIWIDTSPQADHEEGGRRPALVLTPAAYNGKTGLAVLCPITSQRKGYPFEVPLPAGSGPEGVVLADQVRNLDWRARNASLWGRLDAALLEEVLARLKALLGS